MTAVDARGDKLSSPSPRSPALADKARDAEGARPACSDRTSEHRRGQFVR